MITTYSSFYYGHTVTTDNMYLDFDEGGGELTATVQVGTYSLTQFLAAVKSALDTAGGQSYTVSVVDRSTRLVSISAASNFSLLTTSGSHSGATCFSLLGFSGADKTGTNSYTSGSVSGSSYEPQFKLQNYTQPDYWKEAVDATVHESASGIVETVTFGTRSFVEFEITYITDLLQPSIGPIINSQTAISDVISFLEYITTKAPVEFNPDKDSPSTYYTLRIESTDSSNMGVGYKLSPVNRQLPGYYRTGVMKYRII